MNSRLVWASGGSVPGETKIGVSITCEEPSSRGTHVLLPPDSLRRQPPHHRQAQRDRFTDLVKRTYRVLITRGVKGCDVYFEDAATLGHSRAALQAH